MTDELNKIIAKAEDFYEDAVYLFQGERFGGAVNRSYYAMFTIIQGLLLTENVFSKTHQGTMIKFHELFVKSKKLPVELGKMLNEAFEKRQFGDYDIDAHLSGDDAKKVIADARTFIQQIKTYLFSK